MFKKTNIFKHLAGTSSSRLVFVNLTTSSPPFFLRVSRASKTRELVKITPRVSSFLAWGDFHARSRFARSTIPEEKWGTTRSLQEHSLRLKKLISQGPEDAMLKIRRPVHKRLFKSNRVLRPGGGTVSLRGVNFGFWSHLGCSV